MRITGLLLVCAVLVSCRSNIKTNPDAVAALVEEGKTPLARKPALSVESIQTDLSVTPEPYRVGPGDLLRVAVVGRPEFSVATKDGELVGYRVQGNGKIYLPMVGPVNAAGKTVAQIAKYLNHAVGEYVKKPQVTVEVASFQSQKFFVLGQVKKPSVMAADGTTTLLEALGNAGGVSPTGDVDGAYVIRSGKLLPVSLGDILLRGDTSRNVVMRKGDLVYVPDKADWKVYVLGEVVRPGIVPMGDRGLNLADAVAEVGGIDKLHADRRVIRIFRGGWQNPRAFTLSTQDVYEFGASIELRPGDRVVVAPRGLANWSRATTLMLPFLQTAVTAGTVAAAVSK